MKVQVLDAEVSFVAQSLVVPLVLSTGPITEVTEARAKVRVRVGGREAVGRGSICLSDPFLRGPIPIGLTARGMRLCGGCARRLQAACTGRTAYAGCSGGFLGKSK